VTACAPMFMARMSRLRMRQSERRARFMLRGAFRAGTPAADARRAQPSYYGDIAAHASRAARCGASTGADVSRVPLGAWR